MSKRPLQTEDKYVLRMPDGMRDRLKAEAEANGRSMNAEIISKIEQSYQTWPKVVLSKPAQERATKMPMQFRTEIEDQLNDFAEDLFEKYSPQPSIIDTFHSFTALLSDLPDEKKAPILKNLTGLLNQTMDAMPEEKKQEYTEQLAIYLSKHRPDH